MTPSLQHATVLPGANRRVPQKFVWHAPVRPSIWHGALHSRPAFENVSAASTSGNATQSMPRVMMGDVACMPEFHSERTDGRYLVGGEDDGGLRHARKAQTCIN